MISLAKTKKKSNKFPTAQPKSEPPSGFSLEAMRSELF